MEAHQGQKDKGGKPYILHLLRVMFGVASDAERIVGVLHDLVEDTPWTREAIQREGFSEDICEALEALTKRPGEDYEEFVHRVAEHGIARAVKIRDLYDNLDLTRIESPTDEDCQRMDRYRKPLVFLESRQGLADHYSGELCDRATPTALEYIILKKLSGDSQTLDDLFSDCVVEHDYDYWTAYWGLFSAIGWLADRQCVQPARSNDEDDWSRVGGWFAVWETQLTAGGFSNDSIWISIADKGRCAQESEPRWLD